jgi:hypothetical protein
MTAWAIANLAPWPRVPEASGTFIQSLAVDVVEQDADAINREIARFVMQSRGIRLVLWHTTAWICVHG